MVSYSVRDLYGGAMTVELPVELIDSSDLRQVPDHQEVFLSPTTLTSIIFEINAYVEPTPPPANPTTTTTTTTLANGTTTTTTKTVVNGNGSGNDPPSFPQPPTFETDAEAARYHFRDVIAPPDTVASPLPDPQPVRMAHPSLANVPAYILSGNIKTYEPARRSQAHSQQPQQLLSQSASASASASASSTSTSAAPSSSSSSASHLQSLTHQLQLLIRLASYDADLVVRVTVPMKELASAPSGSEEMVASEVAYARAVLGRIVATLGVLEWSLFDA